MVKRNPQMKQSSLPSSLIPHLYTGPHQNDDSPIAAPLPPSLSSIRDPDATHSTRHELPPMRTSFAHPPLPSVDASRAQTYSINDSMPGPLAAPHSFYRNVSPSDPHTPGITQSVGTLPPPSHLLSRPRYDSPIFSDPHYHTPRSERMYSQPQNPPSPRSQEARHFRSSWREGEAGPSSLMHTPHESTGNRERRGSQPERLYRHETYSYRGDELDEVYREAESYSSAQHPPRVENPYPSWTEPFGGEVSRSGSELGLPTPAYPLTAVTSSQWAAGNEYSSVSDASSDGRRDDETSETYASVQKGQKRRRDSEVDDDSKKTRNTRKTAVACNFCRGRKLRCNGAKPKCSHCLTRNFDCEYVPVQRRRGPGKAPKGTKSKKGTPTGRSETSTSRVPDRGSSGVMMAEPNELALTMAMNAHSIQEGAAERRESLRQTQRTYSPEEEEKRYY
ncbi:hypothetical protein H0H92_006523 [Tricholoma furcatifolium]|nr:hypothetical protein H0H92_006523 [Tricholoma furcatifolium]